MIILRIMTGLLNFLCNIKYFHSFRKYYTLFFVSLFSVITLQAQGTEIEFKHLTTEDGLSYNRVTNIIQDKRGFIWFGTYNGLNRFDGYSFKNFLPDAANPFSISSHTISAIYEDSKGIIWVGTVDGLNRFDWKTERFYKYENIPGDPHSISYNRIYSIYEDRNGTLWVGTPDGLNKYDREKDNFTVFRKVNDRYNPDSLNSVICIGDDYKGNLWLGTWNGLSCMQKDGKVINQYFAEPHNSKNIDYWKISAICEDNKRNLWVGTNKRGILKYNHKTKQFKQYSFSGNNTGTISHDYVTSIFKDKSDNLWVGTKNGFNKYDPKNDKFIRYLNEPDKPFSIINNEINSIFEDKSGLIWVGTQGGVSHFRLFDNEFHYYKENIKSPEKGLSDNRVYYVTLDKKNNIWVGTFNGLNKICSSDNSIIKYKSIHGQGNSLSHNFVLSVKEDHLGLIWIGTFDEGLKRFNPATGELKLYNYDITDTLSISGKGITTICEDRDGTLWFGTRRGMNRFDRRTEKFNRFLSDPSNPNTLRNDQIWVISEDSKGMIWVGTDGGGVSEYNPKSGLFRHFTHDLSSSRSISANRVYTILESSDGMMWFGTSDGLNSYDRRSGKVTIYKRGNGLPGNLICSIQEDNKGYLWISTDKGLAKYDRNTGTFNNYTRRHGLKESEFSLNVSAKAKDGTLYFGCKKGLMYFHPDSIKNEILDAPVVFTDIKVYNQTVPIEEKGLVKESISGAEYILIPPGIDMITLDFALLDFFDVKKNTFRYKLDGFDANWNDIGTRNSATYTNLPPGEYKFIVRAAINNGIKNEREASIRIIIRPAFYQTWWFIGILGFSLLMLPLLFIHVRTRSIKKQNKLLEKMVAERTKDLDKTIKDLNQEIASKDKFFSIIAHDLRSPFTGMLGLIEYLSDELSEISKEDLAMISANLMRSARFTFNLLENLLHWASINTGRLSFDPQTLNLKNIITRMIELYNGNALKKGICISANIREDISVFADINMLETIIRNLISNSIKFTGQGGNIFISAGYKEDFVLITIKDNGVGINPDNIDKLFQIDQNITTLGTENEKGAGLGLILCKEFIQMNGGELFINSVLGEGSEFSFTLPDRDYSENEI